MITAQLEGETSPGNRPIFSMHCGIPPLPEFDKEKGVRKTVSVDIIDIDAPGWRNTVRLCCRTGRKGNSKNLSFYYDPQGKEKWIRLRKNLRITYIEYPNGKWLEKIEKNQK